MPRVPVGRNCVIGTDSEFAADILNRDITVLNNT